MERDIHIHICIVNFDKMATNSNLKVRIELLRLLMSADSKQIIQFMDQFRISPDVYLPSVDGMTQLPLIYYCCSNPLMTDLFLYLLEKKVNLRQPIICQDPCQQIELLYYSHVQYIPLLVEHGCRLDPSRILKSAEKLLIRGNINKLIVLYKQKVITKAHLEPLFKKDDLIFRVLDQLYEKVYYLSQQTKTEEQFNQFYDELLINYIKTYKFFFKNGVNFNQLENQEPFVQKVLNTYFYPLIEYILKCQPVLDNVELLHYSNFDLNNRQVMKNIYTETNYQKIKTLLKGYTCPRKITHKKNLVKKVIPLSEDT